MSFKNQPIKRQIITVILAIMGAVMVITCGAFFAYEFFSFRQTSVRELSTLGEIIASNCTAALAFDNKDDASEILSALKAEKHIVGACLYDASGKHFSSYPATAKDLDFPSSPGADGYQFENGTLSGFQPVQQGNRNLGTLYLRSDTAALAEKLQLYTLIAIVIVMVAFTVTYLLSGRVAQRISQPILGLAATAKAISDDGDYSVRATKASADEVGSLTDSFNQMLDRIQSQDLEIKQFNQILEQKVLERTQEMEMVNKELESFSYSISHDLRAPLRSIVGYSQVLLEDYGSKLDEEGLRISKVIINNGKRMGQLIDDLLDFSRMGRKEMQRSSVDVNGQVNEILQELLLNENGRKLNLKIHPLGTAQVDRNMMNQVWINLISNALKYSRKRDITEIEIGSRKEDNKTVFYVRDNGAGFDMLYVYKLFGVFQRLHKMNEFEGTGVGLALVKRIIQRHGGDIWAESALDKGATFTFFLPDN